MSPPSCKKLTLAFDSGKSEKYDNKSDGMPRSGNIGSFLSGSSMFK
jgi:hypothetical protein